MNSVSDSHRWIAAAQVVLLAGLLFVAACSDSQEFGEKADPGKNRVSRDWTNPGSDEVNLFRDCLLSEKELKRQPEFGGIITFPTGIDPTTLNNVTRTTQGTRRVCFFLFPPLIGIDPSTSTLTPLIASELPEKSENGLVYTWRLRPGIKWHDFDESKAYLTAHDVEFCFDLICNEKVDAGVARNDLPGVESVEALDDLTFRVTYSEPHISAMYIFGSEMRIMPSHLLRSVPPEKINTHPLGRNPVGYGPFRFHHWKTGDELLFTRCDLNRDVFPDALRPWADGVRWKVIPSTDLIFRLFLRNEVDVCVLSPDNWLSIRKNEKFQEMATAHFYSVPYFSYIAWNTRLVFFDDPRVRRAMTHLARRQAIVDSHLHGMADVLSGPFYRFSNDYDESIEPFPYDPAKAKELLAEAGWMDRDKNGILEKMVGKEKREFRFELLYRKGQVGHMAAFIKAFTEDLKSAGIIMAHRSMDWGALQEQVNDHRFDAFMMGAVPDLLYEDHYGTWHSSQTSPPDRNRTGYVNSRVDEILEAARVAFDDEKRQDLIRELHRILHEDQPWTPLFTRFNTVGINKRWRNVRIYNKKGIVLQEWWLPRENHAAGDVVPPLQEPMK